MILMGHLMIVDSNFLTSKFLLFNSKHIQELACELQKLENLIDFTKSNDRSGVSVVCTSLGLYISMGELQTSDHKTIYYTISARENKQQNMMSDGIYITSEVAKQVAELIRLLNQRNNHYEIRKGRNRTYHILFILEGKNQDLVSLKS